LANFVRLFTPNARVSEGSGTAFIRQDYASLFSRTAERQLSIGKVTWRSAGGGKIVGTGAYRVGTKESPDASWRYASGSLRIELTPSMGSYKISQLLHR
jgi:hypothetical protein